MKKSTISVLAVVLIFAVSAGCGSLRVKAPVTYGNQPEVGKIALVASFMGPVNQPQSPVGDASTFNKKTDALAAELNQVLKDRIDSYYQTVGRGLEMQLGAEVVYGKEMRQAERFERAERDEDKEALKISGGGKFNRVFVGEGGINTLPFSDGQVNEFIKESPRMRSVARGLTKDTESDAVAFSYHQLVIENPRKFGAEATAKLINHIYIFNDRGENIGEGYGETDPIKISGDDLEEYKAVLDEYPNLQNRILTKMAKTEEG